MRATPVLRLMPKTPTVVIDVSRPTAAWRKALPRARVLVRKMAAAALVDGLRKISVRDGRRAMPLEISIVLATDATVRRLNRIYRGQDKATNVLSFPADAPAGSSGLLGDVIIAFGVAATESKAEGKDLSAHLAHLVVHGVLHLLGYDHGKEKDAVIMERLESDIMARMGFADPYAFLPAKSAVKRARTPKRPPRRPS